VTARRTADDKDLQEPGFDQIGAGLGISTAQQQITWLQFATLQDTAQALPFGWRKPRTKGIRGLASLDSPDQGCDVQDNLPPAALSLWAVWGRLEQEGL
jgi:hypothetical protein